jgi:hypothetical protein
MRMKQKEENQYHHDIDVGSKDDYITKPLE